MSRLNHYEEALAMLGYPQQTYRMVNTGGSYGEPATILAGVATGVKTVMEVRNAEKMGQAQLEMQERLAQRNAITQAAVEQKKAALDAQKAKYMPIYIAGGIAVVGILGLTLKEVLK